MERLERFILRYGRNWREMFVGSRIRAVSIYNACSKTKPEDGRTKTNRNCELEKNVSNPYCFSN